MGKLGVREKSLIHQTPAQIVTSSAGSMWLYRTKTAQVSGYPGDGYLLWDSLTQTSAVHLVFSHVTNDAIDLDNILSTIANGDTIYIQDVDDAENFQKWTTTGAGVNTTTPDSYWTTPVTLADSGGAGTSGFGNNIQLSVFLVRTGSIGTGTVTSVALAAPVEFAVSGSPVTTSGTLTLTKANESANTVWAGPTTGAPAQPAFRALVAADLPGGTGTVTSVNIGSTAGTITPTGGPITTSGTINVEVTGLPPADITNNLGSAAKRWLNLYLDPTGGIEWQTATSANLFYYTDGTGPYWYDRTKDSTLAFNLQSFTPAHHTTVATWQNSNGTVAWLTDIPAAGITALTGDVTATGPGSAAATLATVNTNTGTWGDATHVGSFTVNGKGLITAASSVAITGTAPGGSAGGDLSGTYPNPTVAKINGATLGTTTATSGNLLIGSGTTWVTNAVTGDITITSGGVTAIGTNKVTNAQLAQMAAHTLKANITGSTANAVDSSLSAILDAEIGSTRGQIIRRGSSVWQALALGTTGQAVISDGTDAKWGTVGGGSGGALVFVGSATVAGSAATTLSISGLNLDADLNYFVSIELLNAGAGAPGVSFYYNSDTTAANYDAQTVGFSGTTTTAARANNSVVASLTAVSSNNGSNLTTGWVSKDLQARPRVIILGSKDSNTAINFGISSSTWRTTGTNVTGITLSSSVASALAIGSIISVWKFSST